ncbi:hypothetical protein BOX15_Mlig011651g2, partial [Macrostomum lignano]
LFIPPATWYELLSDRALLIGALFQLACLLALFCLPPAASSDTASMGEADEAEYGGSVGNSTAGTRPATATAGHVSNNRKQHLAAAQKKKRR